jgi:hypothetical protein
LVFTKLEKPQILFANNATASVPREIIGIVFRHDSARAITHDIAVVSAHNFARPVSDVVVVHNSIQCRSVKHTAKTTQDGLFFIVQPIPLRSLVNPVLVIVACNHDGHRRNPLGIVGD